MASFLCKGDDAIAGDLILSFVEEKIVKKLHICIEWKTVISIVRQDKKLYIFEMLFTNYGKSTKISL